MASAFTRLLIWLVSAIAALIGLAIVAGFLAPWLPAADSLAHFRLHLTAALGLAAALLLAVRSWRRAGVAAVVSAAGFVALMPALPLWSPADNGGQEPSLVLVQLNLSYRNRTPQAVADFVRSEDADVVTLQEVTDRTARVIALLEQDYPNRVRCPFGRVGAVAVLSRLPKAPGESAGCEQGRGLAWLRVVAAGRPVSVASVHLHWPYPFGQAVQIKRLQGELADIPRPVLLAGDFNAAPWSHAVARMSAASDTTVAGGLRFTFRLRPLAWAPPIDLPIDHVLVPAGIVPIEVRAGPGPGSDHRSVVARLALPPVPAAATVADPSAARLAARR